MAEETGDAQEDLSQVDRIVKQHDHAGTKRSTDGARAFEGQRCIQLVKGYEGSRCAAQKDRLKPAIAGNTTGKVDELPQPGAHRNFIDAGTGDMPTEAEEAAA